MANITTAGKRNSAPSRAGWHGASRKSRLQRLPWSGPRGAPEKWSPTEDDWSGLQTAYGETFDTGLRAEIDRAVQEYFFWAPFEDAPFADDCVRKLAEATALARELGKAVHSFGGAGSMVAQHWERYFPREDGELIDGPADEDDSAFAHRVIALPSRSGRDHRDFRQVVHTFHSALSAALQDVKSSHLAAFSEGDAWEHLVVDLARAFRGAGFRVTASKSKDGPLSAFVRFVNELQVTFEDESFRRHPTPAGLSGAISLALRHLTPKRRTKQKQRLS
jgi:hypothetical protein